MLREKKKAVAVLVVLLVVVIMTTVWRQFVDTQLLRPPAIKCRDIPIPPWFWDATIEDTPAFVDILRPPVPLDVGETVCVRVVVPGDGKNRPMLFAPFPDTPWDSVMLDLVGNNTGFSVPVELAAAEDARNYDRYSTHVYEADVLLRDVDVYHPEGYLEYRDARWNPEDPQEPQPYVPEKLYISDLLQVSVVDRDGSSPYSLSRYMDLPQCNVSNPEGRWISVSDIPFETSELPLPDNNNRIWMPYDCRLKRISYHNFAQCLVEKYPMMHVFGDSNTRRYMKKITTLGEWCSTAEEQDSRECICEDYIEPFDRFSPHVRYSFIDMDPLTGGRVPSGVFSMTRPAPGKTRIMFRKWEGLISPDWEMTFNMTPTERTYGHPQVAIFSLTNWDSAFSTRAAFLRDLDILLNHIEREYSASTEIIVRTGQYFCCRSDSSPWKRKYSRLRNKSFDRHVVDAFKRRFGSKRKVSVWDVSAISENQPQAAREQATACAPNHARSEVVETENQVLFNYLCGDQ